MRPAAQNLTARTVSRGSRAAASPKAEKPAEQWWRIEVTEAGKVLSCEAVEFAGAPSGEQIFYVRARGRARAGRIAFNQYCAARQKKQRAKLVAEGKCPWCGRKNDRDKGRCALCLEKDAAYGREARARARGEDIPKRERATAVAARAHEERKALRLGVLNEVREAWVRADSFDRFARWLAEEILAAGGGVKLERAS